MGANIVTIEDLEEFKEDILKQMKEFLLQSERITLDKWLKSNEVMAKLGISPGTLQNLRVNGTIPFTKLGGIIYYDEEEIHALLLKNRFNSKKGE